MFGPLLRKQLVRTRALSTTTASLGDEEMVPPGRIVSLRSLGDSSVRWYPEYLQDADFERVSTWDPVAGEWDVEGAEVSKTRAHKYGHRGWRVDGAVRDAFKLNKTSPLHGDRDVKLTGATTELVLNGSLNAFTVNDPDNWTVAEAGDGVITKETTEVRSGNAAKFAGGVGGGAHSISQVIAVAVETEYSLSLWLRGDAVNAITVRVADDASGDFLLSTGAWGAAADLFTQTADAYARKSIRFTTLAGATTLTITIIGNPTAAAVGYAEDVSLGLPVDAELCQVTRRKLPAGASSLVFYHKESTDQGAIQYAIVRYRHDLAGNDKEYLQGGGTFAATPVWFSVSSASAAKVVKTFTAGAFFHEVRFRQESLVGLTAQIDKVFFADVATIDVDPKQATGMIKEYPIQEESRFSVVSGASVVLFTEEYEV